MPTGYTAIINDKPDVTFAEFAWGCARAFGAFVMQRDDPCEPPNLDEQPSDYHKRAVEDATLALSLAKSASDEELTKRQRTACKEARKSFTDYVADKEKQAAGYRRMLAEVEAWVPPTSDHKGLKGFMVEQLKSSIDFDCGETKDWTPPELPVAEYRAKLVADATKDLEYHEEEYAKELARVKNRNTWKSLLVKSIGLPPDAKAIK